MIDREAEGSDSLEVHLFHILPCLLEFQTQENIQGLYANALNSWGNGVWSWLFPP